MFLRLDLPHFYCFVPPREEALRDFLMSRGWVRLRGDTLQSDRDFV